MGAILMQMNNDLRTVAVPDIFVDEYMPYCNPVFAVVYITGLRWCLYGQSQASRDLSEKLGISEEFVISAWRYWQQEGIVTILNEGDEISVRFLPVGHRKLKAKETKEEKAVSIENAPVYSPEELNLCRQRSAEVRELFATAERILAKPLKYTEMNLIFSLYDWLGLPLGVIAVLLEYCASNGKTNGRYIEAVALDWAKKGIDSAQSATDYITNVTSRYRDILKCFGQGRRDPAPKELEFMDKWLGEYKTPMELVLYACEITLTQTGKAAFPYADTIITNWRNENITTVEQAKSAGEKWAEQANQAAKPKRKASGKASFNNFKGRDIDFDALEKKELEFQMQAYKKTVGDV
ncbi:hypothetical protein FACS189490_06530 [Clostridia bacterium]|nr:hypothetical protein FACS189490_06530 [Clostridia bacterium]